MGAIVFGGNFMVRASIFLGAIFLVGNYPAGNYAGSSYPGAIFLRGNCHNLGFCSKNVNERLFFFCVNCKSNLSTI